MFDNIGSKIKGCAYATFFLGVIASIISGITLSVSVGDIIVVLTIMLGSVGSWIVSLLIYGFGELVDKTCDIARHICGEEYDENDDEDDDEDDEDDDEVKSTGKRGKK